jgi:hypothetical protein
MSNKTFNNVGCKIIEECSLNFGNEIVIKKKKITKSVVLNDTTKS